MSDFNKLLKAIATGDKSGIPAPNTAMEKYLGRLAGTYTGSLPVPQNEMERNMRKIAERGMGIVLPVLTNPATGAQILAGFEAIDETGAILPGGIIVEDATVTPSAVEQTVEPQEGALLGYVTIEGDANLAPENIKAGVSIFGVEGTVEDGGGGADGTITDASYLFAENRRLNDMETLLPLVKAPSDMRYMFYNSDELVSVDLSHVDTSNVAEMGHIFVGCTSLTEILGFSAVTQIAADLPCGSEYDDTLSPLKRLTFRTDMPDYQTAYHGLLDIQYCSFEREDLVALFNTLPESSLPTIGVTFESRSAVSMITQYYEDRNTSLTVIDAEGIVYHTNPMGVANLSKETGTLTDEDGTSRAPTFPITVCGSWLEHSNYISTPDLYFKVIITGNPGVTGLLPDGVTACETISDDERALVTARGWTLVEA